MSVLALSLSHNSATLDLLGSVALNPDGTEKLLHALVASPVIDEAAVLSTCNRTEIYAAVDRFHAGLDDITTALAEATFVPTSDLTASCKVFYDDAAVSHLFSVAAGLDSMVIGESQILGQVRNALAVAQQAGTAGSLLNALIQQSLRVGKRVQTETTVGGTGRSIVSAALEALGRRGVTVTDAHVVIVGAGSMASLAARTVADRGARVTCVNRTLERAERLAADIGGSARPFAERASALANADVVITCTGARDLVLTVDDLPVTVRGVIDLALPADVAPEVADYLPLVNLAWLKEETPADDAVVAEIADARALVVSEVRDFVGLRRAAQVRPTVVALRQMGEQVVASELARLDRRLPQLDPATRDEVALVVHRVVDKLLHTPTVRVQKYAADDALDYAAALRDLFELDQACVDAVTKPGDLS